jgi:hypothetical protein
MSGRMMSVDDERLHARGRETDRERR